MSLPETIQAIGINKTGGLEVVEKLTIPLPKPAPDQMLVKVYHFRHEKSRRQADFRQQINWGGVNMIDAYFRHVVEMQR